MSLPCCTASARAAVQHGEHLRAFTDDNGSPHEGYQEAIVERGITAGCPGRAVYCPGTDVTRAQMATLLARALTLPVVDRDYVNDDAGGVHEDSINRVAAAGITLGDGQGRYLPAASVTRDQMASGRWSRSTRAPSPPDAAPGATI